MDKLDDRHNETGELVHQLTAQMAHVEEEQRAQALKQLEQERALNKCKMEVADLKQKMLSLETALQRSDAQQARMFSQSVPSTSVPSTRSEASSTNVAEEASHTSVSPNSGAAKTAVDARRSRETEQDTSAATSILADTSIFQDTPVAANRSGVATHLDDAAGNVSKSPGSPQVGGKVKRSGKGTTDLSSGGSGVGHLLILFVPLALVVANHHRDVLQALVNSDVLQALVNR